MKLNMSIVYIYISGFVIVFSNSWGKSGSPKSQHTLWLPVVTATAQCSRPDAALFKEMEGQENHSTLNLHRCIMSHATSWWKMRIVEF